MENLWVGADALDRDWMASASSIRAAGVVVGVTGAFWVLYGVVVVNLGSVGGIGSCWVLWVLHGNGLLHLGFGCGFHFYFANMKIYFK